MASPVAVATTMSTDRLSTRSGDELAAAPDARIAAIAAWLGLLSRTLKTCRLYADHVANTLPFRENLAAHLFTHLQRHGHFRLEFSAHEVTCDGFVVARAQGRDDDLAMPFYRDGVRAITFNPGLVASELDTLVDLLLRVTGRARRDEDDLVTLLWDADLPHLDMSYASAETDFDFRGSDTDPLDEAGAAGPLTLMPWPSGATAAKGGHGRGNGLGAGAGNGPATDGAPEPGAPDSDGDAFEMEQRRAAANGATFRSEDWQAGDPTDDLEEVWRAIAAASGDERARFHAERAQEREESCHAATTALVRDVMRTELREGDAHDLTDLLARALLEAIGAARWSDAHEAVECLTECSEGAWSAAPLLETLAAPDAPVTTALVRHLDDGDAAALQAFMRFAQSLGPASIEWLMSIVATARQQRTRRALVRLLGELCEGEAERLVPWLADARWYVVRNAVLAASAQETGVPVELFRPLARHPEARVRLEVVRALARADADVARPLLLELVDDADSEIRHRALHLIGAHRHPAASAALVEIVKAPDFHKRPIEEVRPILAALGGCAGDEALPHLEAQIHAPGWFDKKAGPFRLAVARCIAIIGSPSANALLARHARSRNASVREACQTALQEVGRV